MLHFLCVAIFIVAFIAPFTCAVELSSVSVSAPAAHDAISRSVLAQSHSAAATASDSTPLNSDTASDSISNSNSKANSNVLSKGSTKLIRLQAAVQPAVQDANKISETATKTLTQQMRANTTTPVLESTAPSSALEGLPIDSSRSPSSLTLLSFPFNSSSSYSRLLLSYWHPISASWDWLFYSSLDDYSNGFWIERVDYCGSALLQNNELYLKKLDDNQQRQKQQFSHIEEENQEENINNIEEEEEEDEEENEELTNSLRIKQQWNISQFYEKSTETEEKCVIVLPKMEIGKVYMLYVISWMQTSWSAWSSPIVFGV